MGQNRIIAFDLLRAVMLFFLFVLHSGVSFTVTELENWFYYDSESNILFDGVLGFIHAIRIPIFFILSGYLIEELYQKRDANKVLKKRVRRIFLPLLFVVLTIGPFVNGLFAQMNGLTEGFTLSAMFPTGAYIHFLFNTTYVWFLYFLFLYNVIHYILYKSSYLSYIGKPHLLLRIVILFVGVIFLLFYAEKEGLFGDYSLIPSLYSIGGYFFFYLLGISIRNSNNDWKHIKENGMTYAIVGSLCIAYYYFLKYQELSFSQSQWNFSTSIVYTLSSVFLCLACISFAFRYYTRQNKWVKYISDSSYFLYLIHFPILLSLTWLLSSYSLNPFIKFLLILCPTILFCLFLNHFWIKAWKGSPPL